MAETVVKWNVAELVTGSERVGHLDYTSKRDARAHVKLLGKVTPRDGGHLTPSSAIIDDDLGPMHLVRVELRAPQGLPFERALTMGEARGLSHDLKLKVITNLASLLENIHMGERKIQPLVDPADVLVFETGAVLVLRVYDFGQDQPSLPRGLDLRHAPVEARTVMSKGRGQPLGVCGLVWSAGHLARALGLDTGAVTQALHNNPAHRHQDVELFIASLRDDLNLQQTKPPIFGPTVAPDPQEPEREPEREPPPPAPPEPKPPPPVPPPGPGVEPIKWQWALYLGGVALAGALVVYLLWPDPPPKKLDPVEPPVKPITPIGKTSGSRDTGAQRVEEISPSRATASVASTMACRVLGAKVDCDASLALDDDRDTAWCYPVGTRDGTAYIDVAVPSDRQVVGVYLSNGYQKSHAVWSGNGRLRSVRFESANTSQDVELSIDQFKRDERVKLKGMTIRDSLRMVVTDARRPDGAEDICLTEIQLSVRPRN